jgi:Raf kinase inhibitor-like YbhB/YbcL family protein
MILMKRLIFVCLLILTACMQSGPGNSTPAANEMGTNGTTAAVTAASTAAVVLTITSPSFVESAEIPQKYTCQGDDISPALAWSTPPAGTQSLALIVDDPDAPGGTWVHWVVYNLPADSKGLSESASQGKSITTNLPQGAIQAKNSFNRPNYGGPCPPSGEHHYIFHLYALDTMISGKPLNKIALLKVMDGHILALGELTGLYKKK